jgi:glycosyltransferase involved in cell wall biosynthesis
MSVVVAHVMRTYGVHGGERQLAQLFRSFEAPGFHHLFVFVYRDDMCQRYFSGISKLRTEELLGLRVKVFPSLHKELLLLLLLLPMLQLRLLFALCRNDCRICVAHGVQGAVVAWLAAIVLRKVRFVYVHRGTKSARGKHPLLGLLYRPYDIIAGVSHASADSLKDLVPHVRPVAIENGIDSEAIERRRALCLPRSLMSNFTVVCVGRLMPEKGQGLILEAFASLRAKVPTAELLVIGGGPDADSLSAQAMSLGVAEAVRFLGDRNDVVCLLSHSDVFVHASESEGLSNAVLEAMAVGLPSVVVAAPGVTECHIDGSTAYVVSRNRAELGDRLLQLAQEPEFRARMGLAAWAHVREHYSMAANCARYAALYRQLT